MMQVSNRNKNIAIAVFCICGLIINYLAYTPGFLTPDSFDQYGQSLSGHYNDWHPPAMAYLWHLLNKIYRGPQLILLFQLSCLWLSGYFLLTTFRNRYWRVAIALLLCAPFVQNFCGYIIGDSQMALSWLLACSILLRAVVTKGRVNYIEATASFLFLTYGAWVRPNALPGYIPLFFLWVWACFPTWQRRMKTIAALLVITIAITGQWLFAHTFIKPEKLHAENKIYIYDLAGIFVKTGQNVFPAFMFQSPAYDTAYVRAKFHPATYDHIWWNNDQKQTRPVINDEGNEHALVSAWLQAIKSHPDEYLKNRLTGFMYYLRLKNKDNEFYNVQPGIADNTFGIKRDEKAVTIGITHLLLSYVGAQHTMPYMRPWFWFFLNLLMVAAIFFMRDKTLRIFVAAFTCSGLLYQLPFILIFQIDTDFRYFYWNCICCSLAVCLWVWDRVIAQSGYLPKKGHLKQ